MRPGARAEPPLRAGRARRRAARLARERAETARVIDALAAEEHVHLVHRLSAPRATRRLLGLTNDVLALVFALDGVLAASAEVHAAAWEETFDELLAHRAGRPGERFAPSLAYNPSTDYAEHLHGRPRLEGVRSFLASRGITLPEGAPDDPPGRRDGPRAREPQEPGRCAAASMRDGVAAFEGSRRYLEAAREAGLRIAVVSSSANTHEILERSGLAALSTCASTATSCASRGCARGRPPTPSSRRASCSTSRRRTRPRSSRAPPASPACAPAASAPRSPSTARRWAEGADRVVLDVGELLDPALRA